MIDITLHLDTEGCLSGIDATGHSGSAEAGKDIICAAASALLGTVSRTLEMEPLIGLVGSSEEKGELHLTISLKDLSVRDWLKGVSAFTVVGLRDLAESYPDYCRIGFVKTDSDQQ